MTVLAASYAGGRLSRPLSHPAILPSHRAERTTNLIASTWLKAVLRGLDGERRITGALLAGAVNRHRDIAHIDGRHHGMPYSELISAEKLRFGHFSIPPRSVVA